MKKEIKTYKELPLEEGKTYTTKFATGEKFTITKIVKIEKGGAVIGISNTVYGIYEKSPHLGPCPLDKSRIIPDKEFDKMIDVCDNCGEPINEQQ